jgi:hypothetical protein
MNRVMKRRRPPFAQLLYSDRLVIELAIFNEIITPSAPKLYPCLSGA